MAVARRRPSHHLDVDGVASRHGGIAAEIAAELEAEVSCGGVPKPGATARLMIFDR